MSDVTLQEPMRRQTKFSIKRILVCITLGVVLSFAALGVLYVIQQWRVESCCKLINSPDPAVKWVGIWKAHRIAPVWPSRKVTKSVVTAFSDLAKDERYARDISGALGIFSYWEGSSFDADDVPVLVGMLDVPGSTDVLQRMGWKAAAALPALEERAKKASGNDLERLKAAIDSIKSAVEWKRSQEPKP